ncbi:MAG: hypothetical protein WCF17_05340, partial [Terracidiphilus sp.]
MGACGMAAQNAPAAAQNGGQASPAAPAAPAFHMPPPYTDKPLGEIERFPGNGDGAYKMHQYRDLFAEIGHSPAESRAKIEKAFQQLFHGDGQEERI